MANYSTISADEAWAKAWTDKVPLVNAYDDQQGWQDTELPSATSYMDFKGQLANLPKDTEILVYCGCPHDESAIQRAEEFAREGFSNVKVVEGGFKALSEKSNRQQQAQAGSM
jgi:rhodanese-related sulfurtransferase